MQGYLILIIGVKHNFDKNQQLRSYGNGTSVYSLIRQTGEARIKPVNLLVYKASDITSPTITMASYLLFNLKINLKRAPDQINSLQHSENMSERSILRK